MNLAIKTADQITAGEIHVGQSFTCFKYPGLVFMAIDTQLCSLNQTQCVCIYGYDRGCAYAIDKNEPISLAEIEVEL